MNYLTREKLETLPTPRLMAYKAKLLKTRDYRCYCGSDFCFEMINQPGETNGTKLDPDYQEAYRDVKDVLKTREHLPRK